MTHPLNIGFFGVETKDMSRDQLIELVHCLWHREHTQRDMWSERIDSLRQAVNDDYWKVGKDIPYPDFCNPDRFHTKAKP